MRSNVKKEHLLLGKENNMKIKLEDITNLDGYREVDGDLIKNTHFGIIKVCPAVYKIVHIPSRLKMPGDYKTKGIAKQVVAKIMEETSKVDWADGKIGLHFPEYERIRTQEICKEFSQSKVRIF